MKENLSNEEMLILFRGFFVCGDAASLKILYELERFGDRNFTELKDQTGLNPATLSKKLKILTRVGLVKADKTHDQLRVYYSIAGHHRPIKRLLDAVERLAYDL